MSPKPLACSKCSVRSHLNLKTMKNLFVKINDYLICCFSGVSGICSSGVSGITSGSSTVGATVSSMVGGGGSCCCLGVVGRGGNVTDSTFQLGF